MYMYNVCKRPVFNIIINTSLPSVVTVGFSASDYTISEGDRLVIVQISVVTGSSQIPLNFVLTTSDGSAVSGEDYEGFTMRPVRVTAPLTSVTVRLIDDNVVEAIEQFQISLVPNDNLPQARVNIDRNLTTITVVNDDGKSSTVSVGIMYSCVGNVHWSNMLLLKGSKTSISN